MCVVAGKRMNKTFEKHLSLSRYIFILFHCLHNMEFNLVLFLSSAHAAQLRIHPFAPETVTSEKQEESEKETISKSLSILAYSSELKYRFSQK